VKGMQSTINELSIFSGVNAIREGKVIVYPTESVYGFGCDPMQPQAIEKIIALKKRPSHKGFILIISHISQLDLYLDKDKVTERNWGVVEKSWPGPVTWILPAKKDVNDFLLGPNQTIAIRMTAHPISKALCDEMNGAIVSTSVNRSEQAPIKQPEIIQSQFSGNISGIVAGDLGTQSKPSWVIDFATQSVLRQGSDINLIKNLGITL